MSNRLRRLISLDWDAIAGVLAAVTALVLHLLHLVQPGVLLTIILVILALLLIRDLRRERQDDRIFDMTQESRRVLEKLEGVLRPPDVLLIGPGRLRSISERFAAEAQGEMTYFNVCLSMFKPQPLFDKLLRPAIENPRVARIQFVLDEGERERWTRDVVPKLKACSGATKMAEPCWCKLEKTVSFILSDKQQEGKAEALLSFWGEPFMSRTAGQDIPRYIFHVQGHSELVARLYEVERQSRIRS
jgi:hypothetical protein